MPLGIEVGLSQGDLVLDGDPAHPPKGGRAPKFLAHVYCGETAGWIKMALGKEVGLGPGHIVLDGDQLLSRKRGYGPSSISAHFYCGQTAGCIKMPLGIEVGLRQGTLLDGDPAPRAPKMGGAAIFGPCVLWPNGCMDQDATWYGDRPLPTRHCVRLGPSSPSPPTAPNFRPMFVVAKRLDGLRWHLVLR